MNTIVKVETTQMQPSEMIPMAQDGNSTTPTPAPRSKWGTTSVDTVANKLQSIGLFGKSSEQVQVELLQKSLDRFMKLLYQCSGQTHLKPEEVTELSDAWNVLKAKAIDDSNKSTTIKVLNPTLLMVLIRIEVIAKIDQSRHVANAPALNDFVTKLFAQSQNDSEAEHYKEIPKSISGRFLEGIQACTPERFSNEAGLKQLFDTLKVKYPEFAPAAANAPKM
jgi:hypothetical protein